MQVISLYSGKDFLYPQSSGKADFDLFSSVISIYNRISI